MASFAPTNRTSKIALGQESNLHMAMYTIDTHRATRPGAALPLWSYLNAIIDMPHG